MISKFYIAKNLNRIHRHYINSSNVMDSHYYSKMAIIELCGWIEISMDDVVNRCSKRVLKSHKNIKHIDDVIKYNYGFQYNKHFKKMLQQIVGLYAIERVEKNVDLAKFDVMCSTLDALKENRNKEAHTYIKGVTHTIDAPSLTLLRFSYIYDGLVDYESALRKLGY